MACLSLNAIKPRLDSVFPTESEQTILLRVIEKLAQHHQVKNDGTGTSNEPAHVDDEMVPRARWNENGL